MRTGHFTGSVLKRGDRLDQTLLIHFFLVETGIVQQGGEEVDEEVAHHRAHDVHHEGDGDEGTQNTHYGGKNHETDIEVLQMVILHLLHVKLQ